MKNDTPSRLTDAALDGAVKRLAASERDVTVELIVHLAELDTRRLYLGFGFSSLFTYCRKALALSEQAAFALTALLEDLARTKFAATDKPRASHGTAPGSRTIPAAVERAVWSRDGGQCAFVTSSGRRCDATAFLEFHHIHPHGVGGPPTIENIALRCQAHNQYEAKLFYGRRGYGSGAVNERRAWYGNSPQGESRSFVGSSVQ